MPLGRPFSRSARSAWRFMSSPVQVIRGRSLALRFALGASAVGSIPLIVTGLLIDRANTTTVETSVQRDHESALDQATVAIETSVEAIFADLKHLSGGSLLGNVEATEEELTAELERFYAPIQLPLSVGSLPPPQRHKPFEELAAFSRHGTPRAAINHRFTSEWATSKWMLSASQGTVSYTAPHFDLEKHRLVISIAVPAFSATGDVAHVVGAQVDLGRVLSLADLEGFAARQDIDLRLIDRFGNYLAGVPGDRLLDKAAPFPSDLPSSSVVEFSDGSTASVGGERRVGAGTVWAGEGWRIRSVEPVRTAYAEIASARRNLMVGLSTGFLLIILISLLVGRGLTGSLRNIARTVTRFGHGDYTVRLRLASNDELGKVTTAFNSMADSLQQSHRELEESNHAKGEFISSLSHELRTPLAAMLGFADLLKKNKDGNLTPRTLDHIEVITRNGRRLENMIADLLDLTRIENKSIRLDREWFDVIDLIEDIALTLEGVLSKRQQKLIVNIAHDAAWLNGDKNRIAQVLTNVISNASKYSDKGKPISFDSVIEQDELRISVEDQGQGIKPEDMDQMFTLFFRTEDAVESSTPGTGIGLYVTKQLVELHGGDILLDSRYGVGTTVTICLPGVKEAIPVEFANPEKKAFSNRFKDPDLEKAS